jgi:hypothetical protein
MCVWQVSTFPYLAVTPQFVNCTRLDSRPVSRAAVIFPAGVRQFRLVRRRAVINPAGGSAKLFRRRLAARRKFV